MLNETAARSRALSAKQPRRLDRPPAAYEPLNVPVGRQEPQAVERVEHVAQGPVVDPVVDLHESGGQAEPADPQEHPGGVQQFLRAGALSPPEEPQESSLSYANHTWHGTPQGIPRGRIAVADHPQLPPVDTITPPVPHRYPASFSDGPGTKRGVSQPIYCRKAAATRCHTNPPWRDKRT